MGALRSILGAFWFIHLLVFLGLAALAGNLSGGGTTLIWLAVLSFAGAVCGSFIRILDAIRKT